MLGGWTCAAWVWKRSSCWWSRTLAVVGLLLEHVADALADAGDLAVVTGLVADVSRRGNGASFQRDTFRRTGLMRDVVRGAASAVTG